MRRLTQDLLDRAARAAEKHADLTRALTDAFNDRYRATYSDVDADEIIDTLDYGTGGNLTVKMCDAIMTEAGHPPHAGRSALAQSEDARKKGE